MKRKASKSTSSGKKSPAPPLEKQEIIPTSRSFPIVGVGASAGGFEAFADLLRNMPANPGVAFVLVQHLDPSHGSLLPDILSRAVKMPVKEVTDGVVVEPNTVYVIPANSTMVAQDGRLRLGARVLVKGQHMPIDQFFRSLAEQHGNQAIGVILSGTASDGTEGCLAIKAAGGITFAQDEASAKFSGMPRNAIAAGCIDFVMKPNDIAKELVRLAQHPYVARVPQQELGPGLTGQDMEELLNMVSEASGVDFSLYKQTTLQRRIRRRIVLHRLEKLSDYVRYIRTHPKELDELYRDILIHVTGFFRDPAAFDALRVDVFPALLRNRNLNDNPIRIWVPGCSTGEEVYSIGIVLLEYLWDKQKNLSLAVGANGIQIFATDISDTALDRARTGLYSDAAMVEVAPERLSRFFLKIDGGYQINKALREMCIFAKQNVTKDPPFSNLDLISCRNLLIYLGPQLQKRVIPVFHYALKPDGYLLLGGSESLGSFADHFTLTDKKQKIYQKKATSSRLIGYFTNPPRIDRRTGDNLLPRLTPSGPSIEKSAERVLMTRFAPPSVVINDQMEVLHVRGRTGRYLEVPEGQPTASLSKMAREGLMIDLHAAVTKAKKTNAPVHVEGVHVKTNGGTSEVNLSVVPMQVEGSGNRYYMIVFQEAAPKHGAAAAKREPKKSKAQRAAGQDIDRLRHQNADLKQQLQSLFEDHETTTEEFKSANEEVLSANEELQSTNEELETAKEELQSGNEELTTLNEELHNRNAELSTANNDLVNLLANVSIALVMVGSDLRIRRFTPPAEGLLNLITADVGRRIGDIRPNVEVDDLEKMVRDVVDTATAYQQDVRGNDGKWYLLRVRPYKTWDSKIDGAVVSLQDIDAVRRDHDKNMAAIKTQSTLLELARDTVIVRDLDGTIRFWNRGAEQTYGWTKEEAIGKRKQELLKAEYPKPFDEMQKELLRTGYWEGELVHVRKDSERRILESRWALQKDGPDGPQVLEISTDITDRKRSETNLRQFSAYLMQLQDEERRRMARDLHDSTGQKLVALKMNLSALEKSADSDKRVKKLLEDTTKLVDDATGEIRTLSHMLHPPLLDEVGLVSAIKWLVDGFKKRAGIKFELSADESLGRLPENAEIALFRVLQESVNNIYRHSGATKAAVQLTRDDHRVKLVIRDNGKGLPDDVISPKTTSTVGVGILGMKERLAQLGGKLEIASRPGNTVVTAVLPASAGKRESISA